MPKPIFTEHNQTPSGRPLCVMRCREHGYFQLVLEGNDPRVCLECEVQGRSESPLIVVDQQTADAYYERIIMKTVHHMDEEQKQQIKPGK